MISWIYTDCCGPGFQTQSWILFPSPTLDTLLLNTGNTVFKKGCFSAIVSCAAHTVTSISNWWKVAFLLLFYQRVGVVWTAIYVNGSGRDIKLTVWQLESVQTKSCATAWRALNADAQIKAEFVMGIVQSSSAPISIIPKHSGMTSAKRPAAGFGLITRNTSKSNIVALTHCGAAPCHSSSLTRRWCLWQPLEN